MVVQESELKFRVNLHDYLDTGLFLDHRPTRQMIMRMAKGKTFLNLFAYTGTATVYAAAGGATTTTTVDMSNTYLGWAQDNMALNGFKGEQHRFLREDCLQWLGTAAESGNRYQLIFLDPPTFSNSKKMETILDIKRDHADLIDKVMALLDEQGVLIFSCNTRNFKLDSDALSDYVMRDITKPTTSEDFRRKPAHKCWCLATNADALKACIP
jgi:23S rRNA (guanine2445-N2)-methyltransferase / 23S rRNA (guanine2069-N7)-methyltransferase